RSGLQAGRGGAGLVPRYVRPVRRVSGVAGGVGQTTVGHGEQDAGRGTAELSRGPGDGVDLGEVARPDVGGDLRRVEVPAVLVGLGPVPVRHGVSVRVDDVVEVPSPRLVA